MNTLTVCGALLLGLAAPLAQAQPIATERLEATMIGGAETRGVLPMGQERLRVTIDGQHATTTLLQVYTADRFRGRVFAADYGLCMLGISASSYLAGVAIDFGVPVRTFAVCMGLVMLLPAAAWWIALRAVERREGKDQ